jgi:hypothetical protein
MRQWSSGSAHPGSGRWRVFVTAEWWLHVLALRACERRRRGRGHPRADGAAWPADPACAPAGAGAWPRPGAALGLGVVYGGEARRRPHGGPRSTMTMSRSTVHWGIARTPRGRRGRSARTTRGARRRRQMPLLLFHLIVFPNAKLEKVNLKISKNRSCRETIELPLVQRVTYVLVIHLTGKTERSCRFSTPRNTVHESFNTVFGKFGTQNLNVRQL